MEEEKIVGVTVKQLGEVTEVMKREYALEEEFKKFKEGITTKAEAETKASELMKAMRAEIDQKVAEAKLEAARKDVIPDEEWAYRVTKALQNPMTDARVEGNRNEDMAFALSYHSKNENLNELTRASNRLAVVSAIFKAIDPTYDVRTLRSYKTWKRLWNMACKDVGVQDTATSSEVGSWIPTALANEVETLPMLTGEIEGMFRHIDMPTQIYKRPISLIGASTRPNRIPENTSTGVTNTDIYGQAMNSDVITFTAGKMRARFQYSVEAREDAAIQVASWFMEEAGAILQNGVEDCIINGDSTAIGGTHMDYDRDAAGDFDSSTTFKGLRKLLGAGSLLFDLSLTTGPLTQDALSGLIVKTGKYAVKPSNGSILMGAATYLSGRKATNWPGIKTMAELGSNAVIVTGQVASLWGHPVTCSETIREDVANTGYNAASGNTFGVVIYVYRPAFYVGDRRLVTVAVDAWPMTEVINIAAFRRLDFQPFKAPSTTYNFGAVGRNFTANG